MQAILFRKVSPRRCWRTILRYPSVCKAFVGHHPVYIVSQTSVGASLKSRSVYRWSDPRRRGGHRLHRAFANSRSCGSAMLGLWIALPVLISLLGRTPRGYALLAGYTASLIGFPPS